MKPDEARRMSPPFAFAAVICPSEAPASSPHAAADGDPLPLLLGALPLPLALV